MPVDSAQFHAQVYDICRLIPRGKVTTYGHIAKLTGHPSHSRMVGAALKFVGDPSIPWQRVLGSSGAISDRGDGGEGARLQADRLREGTDQFQMPLPHWIDAFGFEEGVDVSEARGSGVGTGGRWRVNLNTYGWFPAEVELSFDSGSDPEADDP